MDSIAINDMLERGQLQLVDMTNLEEFLGGEGLQVLFFAGDHGRRGDAGVETPGVETPGVATPGVATPTMWPWPCARC